ncbi:DNA adenine methylase [Pseudomonas aeruginosa]|uniref:DNA adenine methylase n=1 Tax=Pseudomonas aeruginosa TaxID=287 RepID=UPI00233F833B|nr:DNA adenine methylase [Pseudomonas aeruginosa]MDC3841921.1 DNA adenine methylase [Pseudomonas aeruginosa]
MGSKTKLLSFINSVVSVCESKIQHKSKIEFTDLFAGSGKVSEYYKNKFNVTANDLEYYSYVILKNILQADSKVAESVQGYLDFMNNIIGAKGFITRNYSPAGGRLYFTEDNAQIIDAAISYVHEMRQLRFLKKKQFYYLLGCVLEASTKVANTAGHYSAYLKTVQPKAAKRIRFEHISLGDLKNKKNKVISKCASEAITEVSGDILYLDPPYTFNYSSHYHLLNTIAKYDEPEVRGVSGQRGDNNKSPWSNPSKAPELLGDLLEKADFKFVVMSYSNDSIMSAELVADVFASHGKYSRYVQQHQRYKSRKDCDHAPAMVTEYLHVLEK